MPPPLPLDPPADLDPDARRGWDHVSGILIAAGRDLGPVAGLVEAYARTYARWLAAERSIDPTGGPVFRTPYGLPAVNPHCAVADRYLRALVRAAQALELPGLKPSAPGPLLPVKRHALETPATGTGSPAAGPLETPATGTGSPAAAPLEAPPPARRGRPRGRSRRD